MYVVVVIIVVINVWNNFFEFNFKIFSYLEIYNEYVRDFFRRKLFKIFNLRVREYLKEGFYVEGKSNYFSFVLFGNLSKMIILKEKKSRIMVRFKKFIFGILLW